MWWDWEGGGGEAPREETPVDFDFISLLAKPKVRRERDGDATPPPILPPVSWVAVLGEMISGPPRI